MKPEKGRDTLQVPITFDSTNRGAVSAQGKPLWFGLVLGLWILSSIVVGVLSEGAWRVWYPLLSFIVVVYIVRFLIVGERQFRERRKELVKNSYMFDHSVFWNIYEISNRFPYIVQFANGHKGIFVALDKDVIVGKDEDYDYYHHEAIADAYLQMQRRGFECIHIDLMDTVGKDTRLTSLFNDTERIENPDLRSVLMRKYDYIEQTMNRVYSSYDVYCFYTDKREDIFWEDLQVVLGYFKNANYIRARVLNREGIATIVESLMNLESFSVNKATDNLHKELNRVEYIRPIWVENNGERITLNKTLDELEAERRVKEAERKLKKKHSRILGRKKQVDDSIDLFE